MKRYLLLILILVSHQTTFFNRCYSQIPKDLGSRYYSAAQWVKIQQYEKAKRSLEQTIANPASSSKQLFYSKLLLAQIYSEGREPGKSLELYNDISNDKEYDMPAEHVCRYLDLLRRNGAISKAIEVTKRYHSDLSLNDRFVNIESALNSYYQYYQNQRNGKYVEVSVVKTPNDLENSYAYGIIPYGSDYLLLMNRYNYNDPQSFYTNARIVPLYKKNASINAEVFSQLGRFVQQGPATFMNNNTTIIFTANEYSTYNTGNRPYGSVNSVQLYSSTLKKNGKWSRPVNISNAFTRKASNYSFLDPSVDPQTKQLYFASDMKGGFGGTDIYYSNYDEKRKQWGAPINMGDKINTNGDELFPHVKNDTLLFSSNGLIGFGDQDIYLKKISTSDAPLHFPYPVNTQFKDISPVYDNKTQTLFFSSDRNNQRAGYVLEQVYSLVSSLPELILKGGKVQESKLAQGGTTSGDLSQDLANDPNGNASAFNNNTTQKDTTNNRQIVDLVGNNKTNSIPSYANTMDIIHFDLNKYVIKSDQYQKLDKIYSTFISDPVKATISIDGHTDITGTERHNIALSEMRAKSVMTYLINKGIPKSAFEIQWFGYSRPIATCKKTETDDKCQEINALNRRSEVYIKRIK